MSQTTKPSRPALVIPALLALSAVTACGQKGPLYLPGSQSEMQTLEPQATGPEPEAASGNEDGDNDESDDEG